jgi:hypothetical protein
VLACPGITGGGRYQSMRNEKEKEEEEEKEREREKET